MTGAAVVASVVTAASVVAALEVLLALEPSSLQMPLLIPAAQHCHILLLPRGIYTIMYK